MNEYDDKIKQIGKALHDAEFVLIGGGAGLSAAAGIDYNGENFRKSFAEYIARYGFTDLYTSSFYDFATEEELWAYWAKHIDFARFAPPAMPLYSDILRLVEKKNYFVVTTNVEAQFRKAGFDPNRLFEVQGDYAYLQCARKCHNQRYYSEIPIKQMVAQTAAMPYPFRACAALPRMRWQYGGKRPQRYVFCAGRAVGYAGRTLRIVCKPSCSR